MANKIGWCSRTINPITGCLNGCDFCYARKFAHRLAGRYGYPADEPFRPTLHRDKLDEILNLKGSGKRIFVSSMGDWFSEGVKPDWVAAVLWAISRKPEHHFLTLTKRPDRILEGLERRADLSLPDNLWIGVSVTCQEDTWRIDRLNHILLMVHKFVSFEPLLGPIKVCTWGHIEWAIIGAETGNRQGKIEPKVEWAEHLASAAFIRDIPVFIKDNLLPAYQASDPDCVGVMQQFPEGLQ